MASIVDYLKSQGQDSSYANRATLASQKGIQGYQGTAAQNTQLLGLLSQPAPTTVSTSALQPGSKIAIPPTNVSQMPQLPVVSPQETAVNNAMTQNSQAEQGYTQANTDLQTLSKQLENKGTDTLALEQQQGIPQISQKVLELQDLANQKALEANLTPYSLQGQGRGITTGILRGQEAVKQRQLQVEGIFANAQLQAAQGKLQLAQSQVDRAITLKYEPILAKIDAQKQILENNKYLLSRADQKLATAKSALLDQQKMEQEQKMAEEKAISDVGMTLRKYGVSDAVIKDVLASSSVNDAIMKAGNNLQDPKAKMELENMRVEQLVKRAELAKVQRATALLGQKTPAETKAELTAIKKAKAGVPVLEDKMLLLDGILSSDAIDSVAGPTFLSRAAGGVSGIAGRFVAGAVPGAVAGSFAGPVGAGVGAVVGGTALAAQGLKDVFGDRQNLIASVSQLTDKAFLDELLLLKERGGTLGQVTEREGQALKNAATRFGKWEIKDDKGNVVGYNVSEKDFRDEVEKMKKSTNRILTELRGSQYSAEEQQVLDEIFNNDVDPSAYFQ